MSGGLKTQDGVVKGGKQEGMDRLHGMLSSGVWNRELGGGRGMRNGELLYWNLKDGEIR